MNPLAANRTIVRPPAIPRGARQDAAFVEDLNWPASRPVPDRKGPRPTALWVPGRNGQCEGGGPTLQ
jgi:hypothetical protein